MKTTKMIAYLALVFGVTLHALTTAASPTIEWIEQFGTGGWVDELSRGVSTDGFGNVYISGVTKSDAFVSKYNAAGTLLWTEQLGTSSLDFSNGVSADGLGNVYISGETFGSLEGTFAGEIDAFVSKYDAVGTLLWTKQLGTSDIDRSNGVSADGLGNVYISGDTYGSLEGTNAGNADAFLSKYNSSGTLLWTEQFGTSSWDSSKGVSADGLGNVYISGGTAGSLDGTNAGGNDAFVSKYDSSGTLLWTEQLGTSRGDYATSVSADGLGNVYISGSTKGDLEGTNAGNGDAFISKYNISGTLLWTKQLGTSTSDFAKGVSADGLGNVYISGFTRGSLKGTNAGHLDAFVSKYDSSGTLLWTEQFGTDDDDSSSSVSADGMGNVYLSGRTWGSLEGTNLGGIDAFLVKINDPSYPAGDFDEDFDVDGADFLKWQHDLGDAASLVDWENNFGTVAASQASITSADLSSGSTSSTVPEPNTLLLGALASAGLLLRRKR